MPARAQMAVCTAGQSGEAFSTKWTVWSLQAALKTFWAPVARSIAVTCPW